MVEANTIRGCLQTFGMSDAAEVFGGGESNGRWTKAWFQQEHVETASETPGILRFPSNN